MNQRYYSLDVFRGATVALMILVNNPGSWSNIYSPLEHATWHGCTPTDLVFPFFLFAVGNAMAFVMPRFEQAGAGVFWKKVIKRTLLIFLIGLFLNWSPFVRWDGDNLVAKTWENIRIFGVLQRIALCYFFASVIVFYGKTRGAFVISGILLLLYWFICNWLGKPGDPYSLQGYFGTAIDKNILGVSHMYKGEGVPFDPEGISSTMAAIVQVVFGFMVGQYIQQKGKSFEMLSNLLIAGAVFVFAGFCWDMVFPINKKIWTSSYVLYTSGLAMITLGILIYLIEFREIKGSWSRFFDVFGKNPLFIFVLSGFLPRLLGLFRFTDHIDESGKKVYTSAFSWFYNHVCKNIATDLRVGSLVYALVMIAFYWLIVYLLDKKKIYIKV
ncbi:acyltransferase family protein [Sediminibacterium ginsengisoli]|uniref:Predicted acyltransferase n=1 Tax=Sediminibacterium ginsengisoli TaxID=413434 RepID=A0A1T4JUK4_9BACT|nr:heparan-alpha-glucosaminide N-acetyltransferase domain-containing protein [Sediminibacterium ginsengisoli]SJZ33831.1 Predicted acyltransferase [Sediminibacterium ginsengisoli]